MSEQGELVRQVTLRVTVEDVPPVRYVADDEVGVYVALTLYEPLARAANVTVTFPTCEDFNVTVFVEDPTVTRTVPSGRLSTPPASTCTVTLTCEPALTDGAETLTDGTTLATFVDTDVDVA